MSAIAHDPGRVRVVADRFRANEYRTMPHQSHSELQASICVLCRGLLIQLITAIVSTGYAAHAQAAQNLDPEGIHGTLILVGGGEVPDGATELLKKNSAEASILILADASSEPQEAAESARQWLSEHGLSNVVSVDSGLTAPEKFAETIKAIEKASVVWICGGQQSRLAETYAGSEVEDALRAMLQRGGTIAGTSAGAAIMSKVMIASGKDQPEISVGWDLLTGGIVDQHFSERDRLNRSRIAVDRNPGCFGLGIDESTAVIVSGRSLQVTGNGNATILLAKCSYRESESYEIAPGGVADLTQVRRAALQRKSGVDPGEPVNGPPELKSGSLVVVGGGSMPEDVVDRFVELAGRRDARIVVLPTAVPRSETTDEVPGFLKRAEVANISVLTQRNGEVETEAFQSALKSATGVWFGGGRQWNFVDAYEGTTAIELFHDVLRRGGVIGGSSAGATIQGEFLVRGHPLGNTVMMAEGYERGFAFLPGVAIDQHFAQRGRQPDLLPVIKRHSKLLGIGIDEGTAVVVTGSQAEVIGQHSAHFISARHLKSLPPEATLPDGVNGASTLYTIVTTGNSIDLRTLMED
ncbi:MAG: cyanophycinase [Planctomycetaceae bacterium]